MHFMIKTSFYLMKITDFYLIVEAPTVALKYIFVFSTVEWFKLQLSEA